MGLGRVLIYIGAAITLAGVAAIALERLHLPLGRLPGDLVWRDRHTVIYFPWVTCLAISAVGTLVWWLINRWGR